MCVEFVNWVTSICITLSFKRFVDFEICPLPFALECEIFVISRALERKISIGALRCEATVVYSEWECLSKVSEFFTVVVSVNNLDLS
jgi:hypothetical protein